MILSRGILLVVSLSLFPGLSRADVTRPGAVAGVRVDKVGGDLVLSWQPLIANLDGTHENVRRYRIYRGETPDFPADPAHVRATANAGNEQFVDSGAVTAAPDYFYLLSGIDLSNNQGSARDSAVTLPPVLTGVATANSFELSWTDAAPLADVASYRLYHGRYDDPLAYETVIDKGLLHFHVLTGLDPARFHYVAVSAIDQNGTESSFSKRFVGTFGDSGEFRAMADRRLCWPAGNCPPLAGAVQRQDGQELNMPIDWPAGSWVKAEMDYTVFSNALLDTGCAYPDGGGDIFDRLANAFLVLDETCLVSGQCYANPNNVELMNTVTPFGTDDSTGPRILTFDITPYVPLLTGRRYVGANIDTFDSHGWLAHMDFRLSSNPADASPKAPADGVQVIHYHEGGNIGTPVSVSIPAAATSVKMRFFSTGHGANPPSNCDEFCQKSNRILVDGQPVFEDIVWRTDCSPGPTCDTWNACGFPSCTFNRSGWCPGYISCHDSAPCDQDLDASSWLPPGETHDVLLEVEDINGHWSKSLVVYWYE